MASSPNSQPESPPPTPLLPSLPLTPILESPPTPSSSAPPPSTNSPPPPEAAAPPPNATSPPPPPPDAPPPSPPLSPPPSPPIAFPPPPNPPSPPPQGSLPPVSPPPSPPPQGSPPPVSPPPPPPPATAATPPSPTVFLSPPPARSPPAPTPPSPPPSTATSTPSLPVNSTSPPVPPTSNPSPPVPPTSTPSPPANSRRPTSSPSLNTPLNHVPSQPNETEQDQGVRMGVAIGVVAAVIIVGFMMVVICVQRRRKKHDRYNSVYMIPSPYTSSQASGSSFMKQNTTGGGEYVNSSVTSPDSGVFGNSQTSFVYEDLSKATNGFASQNILGAGGFGCVYKGCLEDGQEVAVKKLKDNSGQGDREFKAEVEIISRVHHRYLVSLVGYCITDYQRLLVYEFVPNDTLHHHLHASNKPVMQWTLRVKVACGSARGIAYLHEDCHPRIIHRDIKSANILIDGNFDAKVADFGLAKLAQELELNTHVSTRVMGTFGYMAPEYASSGKLTEKSDVFSFGVVLLELITGRKPVDETRPLGDESLVEWARPLMTEALDKQNFDELADPRLQGNYDRGEMFRMIEAAAACVRHSASKRPKMSQVVRALDTMSELSDISNGMKPGQSEIYDSREQSAQMRMFQRMAFGSQEFTNSSQSSSWTSGGRSGQV